MPKRILLVNKLAPGDNLMMTVALRSLHKAYPGEYQTDVHSPCMEVYQNNPYITSFNDWDYQEVKTVYDPYAGADNHPPIPYRDGQIIISHYPLIHSSGWSGQHFSDGHREHLEQMIGRPIPRTGMRPDIFLSSDEMNWPNPVVREFGYDGPFWIINAGVKSDATLKGYPYYQRVVDILSEEFGQKVKIVQVGELSHIHPALDGVLDLRGKTTLRDLFRLSYYAEGAICAISLQMVVMAAFGKPCVVVAGGREPIRWQHYPNHRFLATNGALACAAWDGCWRAKPPSPQHLDSECINWIRDEKAPRCMTIIRPEWVAENVMMYYRGGMLALPQDEELLALASEERDGD